MRGLSLSLLLSLFFLASCASGNKNAYSPPAEIGGATLQEHFERAATQIASAWRRLAQLRAPTLSELGVDPNIQYSKSEKLRISMAWHGPAEVPVRKIARIMGYKFKVFGDRAENNPIVRVRAKHKMVVDILRDISDQMNPVGGVVVRNDTRTVELYYQVDEVNETQYRKHAFGTNAP